MKAVVFRANKTMNIEDVPIPKINPDEVLIRSKFCGICGTDLHATELGGICTYKPGVIIGHEFAGVVEDVGSQVRTIKTGDRVTVHPNRNVCGQCYSCLAGQYHLCPQVWETCVGIFAPGGLAEYVKVKEVMAFKLPNQMKLEHGALVEPLATGLHAVRNGNFTIGASALVLGAGPIGLLTTQCLSSAGARRIYVLEPSPRRRDLARKLGADEVIDPASTDLEAHFDSAAPVIDFVFECSGDSMALDRAARLVKRGGKIVVVGISVEPLKIDPMLLISKELSIKGTTDYNEEFGLAIDLLAQGRIIVDQLITSILPIEQFGQAFEMLRNKEAVKVLLRI
jgi:2-desacetyl-2-hydroxyethyl bacteriochlorophyllide A dehydrogenase